MNIAKAYILQSDLKSSDFLSKTPNEVVYGILKQGERNGLPIQELHITSFLGRGDYTNKKNITISNDSIPRCEKRWIGADHVLTEKKQHVRYHLPKVVMSSMQMHSYMKAQALPHSIGKYEDVFHITDELGIHNLYGTYLTRNPLAIQKWIEKKYPNFSSSSLFVLQSNENDDIVTDWIPLDNTSVDDPAYGFELARIVGSCTDGASCVTSLRQEANKIIVKQSSMEHGCQCVSKALDNYKNHFSSNNAHYQFLAQSSIMSSTDGQASSPPAASTEGQGAPVGNEAKNQTDQGKPADQSQSMMPGTDIFEERSNPETAEEMAKINLEKLNKNKKEVSSDTKTDETTEETKTEETKEETVESVKAQLAKVQAELIKVKGEKDAAHKTIKEKMPGYDEMVKKVQDRDKRDAITALVNEKGASFSTERKSKLIDYFLKDFGSLKQEELVKIVKSQFENVITPTVKQSAMGTPDEILEDSEITSNFVAQSSNEKKSEKQTPRKPIDIENVGKYIS